MSDIEFLGIVNERSDEEVQRLLEEIRRARERNWFKYGKDGIIEVWRKRYRYRGIPYEIACMQYFSFNCDNPLEAKINGVNRYLVLEYTKEYQLLHDIADKFFDRLDWLWDDCLHSFQQGWSLTRMEEWLHERAKSDIDFAKDNMLKWLNEVVSKVKNLLEGE